MMRPVLLRRLVLFGAPLALTVLEIFHPSPSNASEAIFVLSILGTLGWVVAVSAAAVALRGAGVSRGPFVLLILAAVFLMGGHPVPFGTLAFGSFLAAAVWVELAPTGGSAEATSPAQPLGVPRS